MELTLLWVQLASAAGLILVAAHFMAKSVDHISDATGIGKSFAGVVMLATATSLPELGTGVSSIALVGGDMGVNLAAGDAFGSNLFNLLIIALLDIAWRKKPLLSSVSRSALLVGVLGMLIISLAAGATLLYRVDTPTATWRISPMSIGIFCVFIASMYLIYMSDRRGQADGAGAPVETSEPSGSLSRSIVIYFITASIVVGSAVWLAKTGEHIVEMTGWSGSFVGTLFLALSTSLPELAASFAALRLGSPELAITNVLGSNLFNMGFVLFLDDAALSGGTLWAKISNTHAITGGAAVAMTVVVIVGIFARKEKRQRLPVTPESALLILLYIAAMIFIMR